MKNKSHENVLTVYLKVIRSNILEPFDKIFIGLLSSINDFVTF